MDVLLQRIGRLHRHRRARPAGFDVARAMVFYPSEGLDGLVERPENGLGANPDGPSLTGVYVDVPGLAATLNEIERLKVWFIPEMNRSLVEAATHPEALDRIASERGWQSYRQRVTGKALAEMQTAKLAILDRTKPFTPFPDDELLRTRLGESGVVLQIPEGTLGAFARPIRTMALPAHWSRGLAGDEPVAVTDHGPPIRMAVSDIALSYGPQGLCREDSK